VLVNVFVRVEVFDGVNVFVRVAVFDGVKVLVAVAVFEASASSSGSPCSWPWRAP